MVCIKPRKQGSGEGEGAVIVQCKVISAIGTAPEEGELLRCQYLCPASAVVSWPSFS